MDQPSTALPDRSEGCLGPVHPGESEMLGCSRMELGWSGPTHIATREVMMLEVLFVERKGHIDVLLTESDRLSMVMGALRREEGTLIHRRCSFSISDAVPLPYEELVLQVRRVTDEIWEAWEYERKKEERRRTDAARCREDWRYRYERERWLSGKR